MKPIKLLLLTVAISTGWFTTVNLAFAQTWTQTGAANTNWFSIASSADGSVLFASGGTTNQSAIYISTNSGATWAQTTLPMTNSSFGLAVSADGTTVFAESGFHGSSPTNSNPLFLSTNSGSTWTSLIGPTTNKTSWNAMSADGGKLIVGMFDSSHQHNWVYISTNSGATWASNEFDAPFATPRVLSTADGKSMSAMIGPMLLTTTNAGLTWITNSMPGSFYVWNSIASSVDGTKLAAVGEYNTTGAYVCVSTNAGSTWSPINTITWSGGASVATIACSADGIKLAMAVTGDSLYVSTNLGVTWSKTTTLITNWNTIVSSADGNKLAVTVYGNRPAAHATGGIWTSQTTPAPQMNITPTNGNLTLSWIVPSTNFVMQESPDLGSWADMTNPPVLNLTNLQDEVILPPTNSSGFYRLKTP